MQNFANSKPVGIGISRQRDRTSCLINGEERSQNAFLRRSLTGGFEGQRLFVGVADVAGFLQAPLGRAVTTFSVKVAAQQLYKFAQMDIVRPRLHQKRDGFSSKDWRFHIDSSR